MAMLGSIGSCCGYVMFIMFSSVVMAAVGGDGENIVGTASPERCVVCSGGHRKDTLKYENKPRKLKLSFSEPQSFGSDSTTSGLLTRVFISIVIIYTCSRPIMMSHLTTENNLDCALMTKVSCR